MVLPALIVDGYIVHLQSITIALLFEVMVPGARLELAVAFRPPGFEAGGYTKFPHPGVFGATGRT